MTEQAKVPAIRFAGFTDPWEQRKFVDFVEASGIRNKDNLQLESYSVSNDRGFVPQDEQFENGGTMRDADKTAYWIVEPGSFAYNPARINVGSIGYQSTRKNVIVSSLYEVFKTDHSCDDRFLWHWFKSSLFTKQIEMLQEGGVRLYFFFDKLQKSEIWMPNVDEQRIIGQQFDQLDSLITLHQRKYDKLVVFKKSMLEKMFPKDGESVPEIRFAGFTDPWEQRKLGELITELSSGKSVNSEKGAVGPSDIGILKTSCVSYDMFDPTECKRVVDAETRMVSCPVEAGTLIVSRMNTPDRVGACGFVPGDRTNLFLPDRLWKVKLTPEVDPYLIFVLLVSASYKARLKGMASGTSGSMHNIPKDSFGNLDVTLPRESKEQRTIGSMFEQLDNLITLHQRKLELLQNIKKSLLDKMFV